jgi:hypothetical protein
MRAGKASYRLPDRQPTMKVADDAARCLVKRRPTQSASATMRRALRRNSAPSSVSVVLCVVRASNCVPTSRSSACTTRVSRDGETFSTWAAARKAQLLGQAGEGSQRKQVDVQGRTFLCRNRMGPA